MSVLDALRAHVDRLNKCEAERPPLPTGGDNRTLSEAINTGANARSAQVSSMKTAPMKVLPLRELMKVRKPG